MKNSFQNTVFAAIIILFTVLIRVAPHVPNFSPIGALALFSGTHLDKKSRFIIPLSAMFISDIFIRFHSTMPFVYGSFIITIILGTLLSRSFNLRNLLLFSLLSSLLFFLITNFGVWAVNNMYAKNFSGLWQAYIMGLPFFRNTVMSDFLFNGIFFYGFRFVENHFNNWLSTSHLAKARED